MKPLHWCEAVGMIALVLDEAAWEIGKQASPTVVARARLLIEEARAATPQTLLPILARACDLFGLGPAFVAFTERTLLQTEEWLGP